MNSELPFVVGILPTYRCPELLQSQLANWLAQDYPADRRHLIILEDGGTFWNQKGDGFTLWSSTERYPSLPAKYNELLTLMPEKAEIVAIIETDDTYAPSYLTYHVQALENAELSKHSRVYGDHGTNGERLNVETNVRGRFHSGMAFRVDLIRRIGGWPDTKRGDFDQQLISRLEQEAKGIGDPCQFGPIQFVYRWNTGHPHVSAGMGKETWWEDSVKSYKDVPVVGKLEPKYDARTLNVLRLMGVQVKQEAAA